VIRTVSTSPNLNSPSPNKANKKSLRSTSPIKYTSPNSTSPIKYTSPNTDQSLLVNSTSPYISKGIQKDKSLRSVNTNTSAEVRTHTGAGARTHTGSGSQKHWSLGVGGVGRPWSSKVSISNKIDYSLPMTILSFKDFYSNKVYYLLPMTILIVLMTMPITILHMLILTILCLFYIYYDYLLIWEKV